MAVGQGSGGYRVIADLKTGSVSVKNPVEELFCEIYKDRSEELNLFNRRLTGSKAREFYENPSKEGKPDLFLLPTRPLENVAKIMEAGAKKHGLDDWLKVNYPPAYHYAAALRHIFAWRRGETFDEETGFNNLDMAITRLLMHREKELMNAETEKRDA